MRAAIVLALCVAAGVAWAAPPYEGRWASQGCGARESVIIITAKTYQEYGKPPVQIVSSQRKGPDYVIRTADGASYELMSVIKDAMVWHSPQKRETFEMQRCR